MSYTVERPQTMQDVARHSAAQMVLPHPVREQLYGDERPNVGIDWIHERTGLNAVGQIAIGGIVLIVLLRIARKRRR